MELLLGVFALKESGSFLTPSHPRTAGNFVFSISWEQKAIFYLLLLTFDL